MAGEVYRIDIPIEVQDKTGQALPAAQRRVDQFSQQVEKGKRLVSAFEVAMNRTAQRVSTLGGEASKATTKVSRFDQTVEKARRTAERFARGAYRATVTVIDKATPVLNKVLATGRSLMGKTWTFSVRAAQLAAAPFRAALGAATSLQALLLGGAGAYGGLWAPLRMAGQVEQLGFGMRTLVGDADQARRLIEEMKDFAARTPFEFMPLADTTKQMLAFQWSADRVLEDLRIMGDAAAALGTGEQGIERITRALGQMRAKGRPMAEEMLQLYEVGIPAAAILQEELGLTAEQVGRIGELGLQAEKVIDALLRGMDKRYGGFMAQQERSFVGLTNKIKETFQTSLVLRWGEGLRQGVMPTLQQIGAMIDDQQGTLDEWGNRLEDWGRRLSYGFIRKVKDGVQAIRDLTNSDAWRQADGFLAKMQVAWDHFFGDLNTRFERWWDDTGQEKVQAWAAKIGAGLGGAVGGFLASVLDVASGKTDNAFLEAGHTAGSAFLSSFLEAFDAGRITAKLWEAFKELQGTPLGTLLDLYIAKKGMDFINTTRQFFGGGRTGLPIPGMGGGCCCCQGMPGTPQGQGPKPTPPPIYDQYGRPIQGPTPTPQPRPVPWWQRAWNWGRGLIRLGGGAAAASEAAAAGAGGISAAGVTAVTGGLAAVIGGLVIAGRKGYLPGTGAYVERKLREQEKLYSPENIAKIASIPATFERRKSWWENAWEFIKTPPLTYMKNRLTVELEGRRRELVPPPAPPKPPWKVEVTAAPTFQIQAAANAEEVLSIVRANFQDLADEIQERIAQTLMQSSNNRQTLNFFNRPVILPE